VPLRRLSLTLALVLAAMAGCGPDRAATPAAPTAAPRAAAVASTVAPPNGVDVLFAQMMVVHHAQAVRLSRTLLTRPGNTERVARIADYIAHDQQREIDETNAWLVAWGRPAVDPADPAIARLHGGDAAAHGMLSEVQVRELETAAPTTTNNLFLRRMIEHHTGAITMARSILEVGANIYIRTLAKHVINEQTAENDAMRALLRDPPGSRTGNVRPSAG